MIGIDLHDADIVADLATAESRRTAIDGVAALSGGALDGAVMFAGLAGATGRPACSCPSTTSGRSSCWRRSGRCWRAGSAGKPPPQTGRGRVSGCGSVIFCDGGTDALLRPDDWPARWDLPHRTA